VLHLRPVDLDAAERVAEAVAPVGAGPASVDATGEVTVAVANGPRDLVEAVRRLDAAGLELADIGLRRPTLDDVFLSLTGHTAPREKETVA
jgi:ABC-2 type transport system ATP-binding protein